jgi:protein TonB
MQGSNERITPIWLRPAAVAAIALLHVGIVIGAPWPNGQEPAVMAPLSVQVVPEGQSIEAAGAPQEVQVAEVNAPEVQPNHTAPTEVKEVEPDKPDDKEEVKAEEVKSAEPETLAYAINPEAKETQPTETKEVTEVLPEKVDLPKPRPEKKKVAHKKPAAVQSRARAVSQEAMASVTGAVASANYRSIVAAELNRRKFYPSSARASGAHGVVVVTFTVGAAGRVTHHSITRSSGQSELDGAIHQIMAAISLPPPPGGTFRATVPIRFDIVR